MPITRIFIAVIAAGAFDGAVHAAGTLPLARRVAAQREIERVYWTHRTGARASFEVAVPDDVVERKVRRGLAESVALEQIWGERLSAYRLRRELDRMVRASRLPGRLAEIFAALDDDPVLLQESLARPALVARLIRARFGWDPDIHAGARARAEAVAASIPGARVVERDDEFEVSIPSADGSNRVVDEIAKVTFDSWWADNERRFDPASARPVADAALGAPPIAGSPESLCAPDDTWDGGLSAGAPLFQRQWHAAAWTGSELVIWSGLDSRGLTFQYHVDGARYDPATDTWMPMATSPLTGRLRPSAVWTGSAVMIWGGGQLPPFSGADYTMFGDGALYDPVTDTWTSISTAGAPSARWDAAIVWTGSSVVVYGGQIKHPTVTGAVFPVYDGRRYDPASNAWSSMAASPLGGGTITSGAWLGGRVWCWANGQGAGYDPVANNWLMMSSTGAPTSRFLPVVLGTDREILVWGGSAAVYLNDGKLYDPTTLTWRSMTSTGAPSPRRGARAVWTGSKMFLWGGTDATSLPTWDGAVYDPVANSWSTAEVRGRPEARDEFSMTWTGTEAVLFGDVNVYMNDAKRYNPATRRWAPAGSSVMESRRDGGNAWTGAEWVHIGATHAARYDPALDVWSETPPHAARNAGRAVWTGSVVVAFGAGYPDSASSFVGGRYDPVTNTWSSMSSTGAPSPRSNHSLVWTGSRVIAWGGSAAVETNTGGVYDPATDTWSPTSTSGAPTARSNHTAVWTGSKMIVWGGLASSTALGDGAAYDPSNDTWTALPAASAPTPRVFHSAVWTGSKMIVWGGSTNLTTGLDTGAAYDPALGSWAPISGSGAPPPRLAHAAAWTGNRMLVWGGESGATMNTGGRYDPATDSWTPMTTAGAPTGRSHHAMAWTGSLALVWGGGPMSGGRYALGQSVDDDGDGLSECAGDCNDGDSSVWSSPTDATGLTFAADKATISWDPVSSGSAGPPTYTLYRSTRPDLFVESACPAMNVLATGAIDATSPAPGSALYFLVGAANRCERRAAAGAWSDGTDRGATCAP